VKGEGFFYIFFSRISINFSELPCFIFISAGKASKKALHHVVEKILSSSSTTTPVSFLLLISLPNHCFSFIIALGIEYCEKGSSKNTLLA